MVRSFISMGWLGLVLIGGCAEETARDTGIPVQPGTAQPGTAQPGTAQPGTSQPGTSQPGTAQPGTTQPGAPTGTEQQVDPITSETDAGTGTPVVSGDDPSTPGNDSPEATACTGTETCAYASQTCCVYGAGDAECTSGAGTCAPRDGLLGPTQGAVTVCDGPEDCSGGQVCCVAVNIDGASNTCEASCDDVSGLIGVWQLCHVDDDCALGESCASDTTFPFWGFCG